ncbi:MotE family protein [Ornithinibacillus gellani]|uniref:MotE family protein n=1 Tax=Ornithinibacillus gellani TaxID=2293253 RepID=UPI0016804671|nr:hypothetical protein [Ornithinibacillus gellani]
MAGKMNSKHKKRSNPILWVVFAIVIPIMIVIALIIAALSFAGFEVMDWLKDKGRNIPVVSKMIPDEEAGPSLELVIEDLETDIAVKNADLKLIEKENEDLHGTITQLEEKVKHLEAKVAASDLPEGTATEEKDMLKELAASFRTMEGKQAAQILEKMSHQEAATILAQVSSKVRGSILGAMDPEIAAKLTKNMLQQ